MTRALNALKPYRYTILAVGGLIALANSETFWNVVHWAGGLWR